MNLKLALMVSVLALALVAGLDRLALPEAMSLSVWGLGLIAAGAGVRGVRRAAVTTEREEKAADFATGSVNLAA